MRGCLLRWHFVDACDQGWRVQKDGFLFQKILDNIILTTFFSLITCHHWIVETHMDVFRPRHPDSEAKNTEKWVDRGPHAAFAAKNLLKLLPIAVTDKQKHLSISNFLEAFILYLYIYWSILNDLKQPEGFAATCRNLQQPQKSLKSAILRQNGNWPLVKMHWYSIPMTS